MADQAKKDNPGLFTTRTTDYTTRQRVFGSVETAGRAAVFGQVMGLVGITIAFTALGAYIGRNLTGGVAIGCFIGGFVCIVATTPLARRSERLGITREEYCYGQALCGAS